MFVVDGLDRIEEHGTTRELFVESTLLSSLICPTIIAGPIVLRRQSMAGQVRRFDTLVLANAPVLDHGDPAKHGRGVEFMLDLYGRRVKDLVGEVIPEELLRKLAYYSGGRGRDFVRLVRMTAERAWDRDLAEADAEVVEGSIDERRRWAHMGRWLRPQPRTGMMRRGWCGPGPRARGT